MRQFEFISQLKRLKNGFASVVTIGAFDGVHLGHQQLLVQLNAAAKALALPSVVIIFEPQPNEYFKPDLAPARLMRLREKVLALKTFGVDYVLCLKFDENFRKLSAIEFINKVLVQALGTKKLIVGDDFRFGSDRKGDFTLLRALGGEHGFEVVNTQTYVENDIRVSSTHVRQLLRESKLSEAKQILGRPYANIGRVIYGRQLGRSIGFPTMNVQLGRLQVPLQGVFAVEVEINNELYKQQIFRGVANVGVRPTVNQLVKPILEVHLLDAELNAYGLFIKVVYLNKIRNERRFDNVSELTAQIRRDADQAREYFKSIR